MTSRHQIRTLLGMTFVACISYGLLLVVQYMRHNMRVANSMNNLNAIGLALKQYHDAYKNFPPAYVLGSDDKPWHSWRVLLLPYLGKEELYAKYHFDEPWDGPHNRLLIPLMPEQYRSELGESHEPGITSYLAVVSRRSMWPAYFSIGIKNVKDGTAHTLFLLENTQSDVVWTEPRDLRERSALNLFRALNQKDPDAEVMTLFVDGTVLSLPANSNRELLVSFFSPSGGEKTIPDELWPEGLLADERVSPPVFPDPVDPALLPATTVVPIPEVRLAEGENVLYCATKKS